MKLCPMDALGVIEVQCHETARVQIRSMPKSSVFALRQVPLRAYTHEVCRAQ